MNIEILSVCEAGGKLNIMGAYDTIHAASVPARHPSCTIAMRARFSQAEEGSHRLRMTVCDPKGQNVIPPLEGDIPVRFRPDQTSAATHFVANLQGVDFKEFGQHQVTIFFDGKPTAFAPIDVRKLGGN